MSNSEKRYPKHACQFCGSEIKLVETVIDDEFVWDKKKHRYVPNGFRDQFEHTGTETCSSCKCDWTGMREMITIS
jgi:hypothetical protein